MEDNSDGCAPRNEMYQGLVWEHVGYSANSTVNQDLQWPRTNSNLIEKFSTKKRQLQWHEERTVPG